MDSSLDRQECVDQIDSILSSKYNKLNSKTYSIYNNKDLAKFMVECPKIKLNYKQEFRYAEIGVWASNYSAWVDFLKTDDDYLLIFEDDVKCVLDFKEYLEGAMTELPDLWDAFFFLTPEGNKTFYYKDEEHNIGLDKICKSYQGNWLGGYMLSRSGAEKLINEVESSLVVDAVDIYVFYIQKELNMYAFKPGVKNICFPVDLPTTIHECERIKV